MIRRLRLPLVLIAAVVALSGCHSYGGLHYRQYRGYDCAPVHHVPHCSPYGKADIPVDVPVRARDLRG